MLLHHGGHIVGRGTAKAARAERQTVGRAVNNFQEAVKILFAGNDTGHAEDGVRGIVGMDRHFDAARFRDGDHFTQEVGKVFPQAVLAKLAIFGQQPLQIFLAIACVPAGKVQTVTHRVNSPELVLIHHKARRAVRRHLIKLRAGPVKHGHEVVADALHAVLCAAADVLLICLDIFVAQRLLAKLYLFRNRNGLHHIENKAVRLTLRLDVCDALLRPDLSGCDIVDGGNDAVHIGNLRDILQGNRVTVPIPAK